MSTFADLITFTRGATGTYQGKDGYLKTAAINEPRFEYTVAGESLGLLVESGRANVAIQSEDMTEPNKTGLTVTSNARKAPDNVGFADLCKLSTAAEEHFVQRGGAAVIGTKYAVSCFVRKAQGTVYFGFGGLGIGSNPPLFNLVTGAIHTTGSSAWGKVKIEPYNEEFYRCSAVGIAAGTTATKFLVTNDPSNLSAAGDGSDGAYIWGTQVEENKNFCTSYIPTTVSTVTRGADVTTASLSSGFYYRQQQGTFIVNFKPKYDESTTNFLRVAELGEAASQAARMPFLVETNNTRLRFQAFESNVAVFNEILTGALPNDIGFVKAGVSYVPSSARSAYEGDLISTDKTAALATTRTTLGIMQKANSGSTLTGHIKSITYFPRRMLNSELAALT
jgi:hypothetical protein